MAELTLPSELTLTLAGSVAVGRRPTEAYPNVPKAVEFWEEKSSPPDLAEVRRQENLSNVKKAMGPEWYPKKKKRRRRPRKLTARNAKYIEQKKQQKSK
ncbi:hypothetical protein PInf_022858 [Phytophthora infestans]|nr:hypothetical protein PInf_022597 [Phytophthora infestans]KAI9989105.1 hypothetical protein PInf_022842 [Phytophthora infestans]KAI9989117.1 hypothetical protein PInf_022858 [Phytophthora infestans]